MSIIAFIGLTLNHEYKLTEDDKIELRDLAINIGKHDETEYLYYKKCIVDSVQELSKANLSCSRTERQHFCNQLKRVRNDMLYDAYNDDFALHVLQHTGHTAVAKKTVLIKKLNR